MSQNIVAVCDVDDVARRRPVEADRPTDAAARTGRLAQRPRPQAPSKAQAAANARRPPRRQPAAPAAVHRASSSRGSSATATTARCSTSRRTSTRVVVATPDHMHALDRARRRWTSASTSTCRSRCAGRSTRRGPGEEGARRSPRSSRRWATRATRATGRAPATSTSAAARSATSARCTSGRIVRSATGRRASRVPRRIAPADGSATAALPVGTCHGVDGRRAVARRQLSGADRRSRGICSSASRRPSSTTRSITRSTGAAGWTGARARSATWART